MEFLLGFHHENDENERHENDDELTVKEMFIQDVYGVIMLEINTHDFIKEILICWKTIWKFRQKDSREWV